MDGIFTKNRIEIEIFYVLRKDKIGNTYPKVIEAEEATKLLADEKTKNNVHSFKTVWKQPSWSSQNQVLNQSTVFNHFKNENEIDPFKYRDARLKNYLVSWNVKDENGNDVALTSEAIDQLHQNIALALLDKYDSLTTMNMEEQEKN